MIWCQQKDLRIKTITSHESCLRLFTRYMKYVQCFYDGARDKFIIYPHLFIPKETLYERSERDNVRYK